MVGLINRRPSLVDSKTVLPRFHSRVITSTAFNNDAAILLLTPLIITLVRRRYPDRPEMAEPMAFAVFMSAGVAALPVSNPMNMVVAEFMGISFNNYARHMVPITAVRL